VLLIVAVKTAEDVVTELDDTEFDITGTVGHKPELNDLLRPYVIPAL
jgi:hypothetical protein